MTTPPKSNLDITASESSYKIGLADKIIDNYFKRNFGSLSKADFETLLFSEYVNYRKCLQAPCDDYSLSKELGISQVRIRNLKERKELKYPSADFVWEKDFAAIIKNVHYDENKKKVSFLVDDVNVLIEINHFIETRGWYNEVTLNKKVIVIHPKCFLELCSKDTTIQSMFDDNAKQRIMAVGMKNSFIADLVSHLSLDNFTQFAINASFDVVVQVVSALSASEDIKAGLKKLCCFLNKSNITSK